MYTVEITMSLDVSYYPCSVTFTMQVPEGSTSEEIHQQAYREFREIPIDVESVDFL